VSMVSDICKAHRARVVELEDRIAILEQAARKVEGIAFRQYLDWMHFHELAMSEPFKAEGEAQDFARRVGSLLTLALGPESGIEMGLND